MGSFSRESLEQLRSRIDLIDALSPHIQLQRAGASHKALCPFHEEKTPSFVIQRGDRHYHCFGCGAHGDAIQFFMAHQKMSFSDAVEYLAERFGVILEESHGPEEAKGPSKTLLKEVLGHAADLYHFFLLHTHEGHMALEYLYHRGIDLSFIQKFRFGLAPKDPHLLSRVMREQKISESLLKECGLLNPSGRDFFCDRVTIPILDAVGSVIGFTARAYKPETFGPKYVNTAETSLFKKSRILFGLSYARRIIAKEKRVLIVEGQIDALRLIHAGFPWTVAGQGTAFGEEMVKELVHLGARNIYLALDGDGAGQEAAVKIGHLFQKKGVDVWVVALPHNADPDLLLREKGPAEWQKMIDASTDYLSFLVAHFSQKIKADTPAGKNELVQTIAQRIREWEHPLMIHESLRKLAQLTQTPESLLGAFEGQSVQVPAKMVGSLKIDPDRILEADLLRWLLIPPVPPQFFEIVELNLGPEHFRLPMTRILYEKLTALAKGGQAGDFLSLIIDLDDQEQQKFLEEILQKKVNRERSLDGLIETIRRLLERDWMHRREEIKQRIYSGKCSEAELHELAKQFDELKRLRPQVSTEPVGKLSSSDK